MVDVEIHDCDAGQPMRFQRMGRRDGDVVEQTKPHRTVVFGVVAGRADSTKNRS